MRDKVKRLEYLEESFHAHRITVEAADEAGNKYQESVADMIENRHDFCRVIDGDSLDDVRMILDWIKQQAIEAQQAVTE